MTYFKKPVLLLTVFALIVSSCAPYQKIDVAKSSSSAGGPNTLIYCLPSTRIDINIAVTHTIYKAGPYAQYASKYLSLNGVNTTDSEVYGITGVTIKPVNEPDPDQFYAITFKNYPSNLDKLFSMTRQGLMLDMSNAWNTTTRNMPKTPGKSDILFDHTVNEPIIVEDVDTLYKTILTDASFVKVPIYKKSLEIKNEEDKAKDMAELILKIRKRRLKLMMGEYDYHPEGEALKVIVKELNKQEVELMSNFVGKEIKETRRYAYSIVPGSSNSRDLLWFNEQSGISETPKPGYSAINASVTLNNTIAPAIEPKSAEKASNSLFFRSPAMSQVAVKMGNNVLSEAKVPVYQLGKIQQLPVMP